MVGAVDRHREPDSIAPDRGPPDKRRARFRQDHLPPQLWVLALKLDGNLQLVVEVQQLLCG